MRRHFDTDGADSEKLACAKAVLAVSDGRYGVASRQEMAEEFYAMYGGFLFLGIFLYSIKKRDVKPQYETLGK